MLGEHSVEPSRAQTPPDVAQAFAFRSSTTGRAAAIMAYVASGNLARKLIVALYSAGTCAPAARLTTGSSVRLKAGAWNAVPVRSVTVSAGQTYWLAIMGKGGPLRFRDRKLNQCISLTAGRMTSPPSHWKASGRHDACALSAYLVGTSVTFAPVGIAAPAGASSPGSGTSVNTNPVPAAPSNAALPVVSGPAAQGQTLSTSNGSWTNSPSSYSYQWQDCATSSCSKIAGATASSYTLQSSDVGDTVRSVVTACNGSGCASATSGATGVVVSAPTVNYYVGQSSSGSGNGSSCANEEPASWFNNSANWGAGKAIAPGSVIGLCGTITSPLTAQGSGMSGNPITVYWEPNATLSEPYCNGPNSSCFDTNAQTYLTLDGGTNGSIQATANGTELANQHSSNGVYALGCTGCTFENLTIENMYVHTNDANGLADGASGCTLYCSGILWNGSNVTVANNTLHDEGWALIDQELSTDANTQVYGNTIYNSGHDLALAADNAGGSIGPVLIHDNIFYNFVNWDTTGNIWHQDGIHCYVSTGAGGLPPHYNGLYIYNNQIGLTGNSGANFNADIYLEGGTGPGATPCADSTSPIYMFNNVLAANSDSGVGVTGEFAGNVHEYNNTIIGNDTTADSCNTFEDGSGYTTPTSMSFENNLTTTCNEEIDAATGSFASGQPNHNLYANGGSNNFVCRISSTRKFYSFTQFSTWQSCIGADANSSTTPNASLSSNGSPQSSSPALGGGANLASLCSGYLVPLCSEINGTPRPTTGPWDAGAY